LRADTFLSMYRVLEGILDRKYAGIGRRINSVVMEYIQDAESEPVRAQLNVCREIRNLLTHNADGQGDHLVEPSQAALDSLYEVIAYVQKPQPAISYSTRGDRIMRASLNDRALEVMRRMDKHGFSHVPVISDNRIVGIFSVGAVFGHVLSGKIIEEDTRIREFGSLLKLDSHCSARYMMLDPSVTYLDVRAEFEKYADRNNRLAAVFITSTGDQDGELLGMLTPWDVMGDMPT
jgi:CBS domain-containing protein